MEKVITNTIILIGSIAGGVVMIAGLMLLGAFLIPLLPIYFLCQIGKPMPSLKAHSPFLSTSLN